MRGLRWNTETTNYLIRQQIAHQRHRHRGETHQQERVPQSQHRARAQGLHGRDLWREVVERFTIFVFGCYFHAPL